MQPLWKVLEVPQKIKNIPTIWSSSSTSGYLPKGNQPTNLKRHMQSHVHCGIIYNCQDMENLCPSMNELIKKMRYIYTIKYHLVIRKNKILPFATTWTDPWGHYTKWNKLVRERPILYDPTYMWNLKKINQPNKKPKLIDGTDW